MKKHLCRRSQKTISLVSLIPPGSKAPPGLNTEINALGLVRWIVTVVSSKSKDIAKFVETHVAMTAKRYVEHGLYYSRRKLNSSVC